MFKKFFIQFFRSDICLRWTLGLLLVTVPLIPFRYLPFLNSSFLPVDLIPFFLSVCCGLFLYYDEKQKVVRNLRDISLSTPLLAFFIVGLVSCLGAEKPLLSFSKEIYYFLTGSMLFLVVIGSVHRLGRLHIQILLFVLTAYLVSLYGIIEYGMGYNVIFQDAFSLKNPVYLRLSPNPEFDSRIVSSIGHPIFLGAYFVLALPISLFLFFQQKALVYKGVYLAGSLILLFGLLLTFSRGAWIAGLVGICFYLQRKGNRFLIAGGVVIGFSLFFFLGLGEVFSTASKRIHSLYQVYVLDFGSTMRGQAYDFVAKIVNSYPFLGLGTGMYRYKLRELVGNERRSTSLDTPENMFLAWISDYGTLGFLMGIYILVQLSRFLMRGGAGIDTQRRELSWAFAASLLGFCVVAMTCTPLYFPVTRIVFWILTGLAVALIKMDTEKCLPIESSNDAYV